MLSSTELFTPLITCAQVQDPVRRDLLMGGVLRVMAGSKAAPPDDPAWPALRDLIPTPHSTHQQALHSPAGLELHLSVNLNAGLTGETILVRWPLGGVETPLIGTVLQSAPAALDITREGYETHGYAVPDFLRAYDGLKLLGVVEREAVHLVTRHPGETVLAAVIQTYRVRDRVRAPGAYVRQLLHLAA